MSIVTMLVSRHVVTIETVKTVTLSLPVRIKSKMAEIRFASIH